MSFKYSAFIENTPDMREWLESIGYKKHGNYRKHEDIILSFMSSDNNEPYYTSTNSAYMYSDLYETDIDCRSNPQLFKAVTAIREDSDKDQWFVSINKKPGHYVPIPDGRGGVTMDKDKWWDYEWILSPHAEVTSYGYRKATIKELIEHFK